MRGDFSAWNKDRSRNFRGTLHQQGRVLLDRDWNAQTEVIGEWQETAARDAFGAGVAAIPAEEPNSFKVTRAKNVAGGGGKPAHVEIGLMKGRAWADGLLAELSEDVPLPNAVAWPGTDAVRTATYLGPPFQNAPLPDAVPAPAASPNEPRDAVILETWLEELSPFQMPDLLIEPALGGPDTTERVLTSYRLRLYRMAAGDTCDSIIEDLKDKFKDKGKLTAELKPNATTGGDCPVVMEGGFTGFEHRLYRIEIAETKHAAAYFKWSHFNAGLVGRGVFHPTGGGGGSIKITANQNAIVYSGSNKFYLEALEFDKDLGCWRVAYGVNNVTLEPDNSLKIPSAAADQFFGTMPPEMSGGKEITHFFRLWNGVEQVAAYPLSPPAVAKKELSDNLGILLQFEAEAAGKYTPGDFWTFEVRAGEIGNPLVLIPNLPPQGIFYHRVPLAEVHWTSNTVSGDDIEDCRRIFQPLTKQKTCCTYRVGDGVSSHGDFKKIQDAIDALPKKGGEVCVLPGIYEENVVIQSPHNRNIILKGCGRRTVIRAKDYKDYSVEKKLCATIFVEHGQRVTIESLAVEAHEEGFGIFLEGAEMDAQRTKQNEYLTDITLHGLFVSAVQKTGIRAHTAQNLTLSDSAVYILEDQFSRYPAVYLSGDDMLVERNEIRVLPGFSKLVGGTPSIARLSSNAVDFPTVGDLIDAVALKAGSKNPFLSNDPENFVVAREAPGGLQIAGGSERVRIINNLIVGGRGNGVTLGNVDLVNSDGVVTTNNDPFTPKDVDDDCCEPDDDHTDGEEEDENGNRAVAGPPLYDILIKFNRIFNMGRNGIGLAMTFSLTEDIDFEKQAIADDPGNAGLIFISKLVILKNRIERCMGISPGEIKGRDTIIRGYGGISLAIVEELVIRDNFIIDNCRDMNDPICGIFALAAFGAEISQNEITEHLLQDYNDATSSSVRTGARGGIWIFVAVGQFDAFNYFSDRRPAITKLFDRFLDTHAIKIHANVVSTPMGRSLTTMIVGDASILGNRFTSLGLQPVDIFGAIKLLAGRQADRTAIVMQLLSLIATNVLILDLGTLVMFRGFGSVMNTKTTSTNESPQEAETAPPMGVPVGVRPNIGVRVNAIDQNPADRFVEFLTKGGLINFSDNQCKFNPRGRDFDIALCSVLIAGLADQGFAGNQVSCDMPRTLSVTNSLLVGGTLRSLGNYFRENVNHVLYSAYTYGLLNITSDNESIHCLKISGGLFLDRFNLVMRAMFAGATGNIATIEPLAAQERFCEDKERQQGFFRRMMAIVFGGQNMSGATKYGVTADPLEDIR